MNRISDLLTALDFETRSSQTWTLVGALSLCTLLNGHTALTQSADRCTITAGEQVSDSLASLKMHVGRSVYRRGEPIPVTLTLKAGSKGVYLPSYFADFWETCEHGFLAILTAPGVGVDPHYGCVINMGRPGPGASAQSELKHYVRLEPGEIRTWHTNLQTGTINPGRYCLEAEYLSTGYRMDDVARLPKVRGLMAKGHISAAPVSIDLR